MSVKQAGNEQSKWKDRRKRQLRDELVQSAIGLFGSKGFEEPSVDQIAAATGIAKGTFYLYFKSKSDIVQAVIETGLQMLENTIAEAVDSAPEQASQALLKVADSVVKLCAQHRPVLAIVAAAQNLSLTHLTEDAHRELCRRYRAATSGTCEKIIRKGMLQGYFREVDAQTCAVAFWGMLYELACHAVESGEQTDNIASQALEYITKGIGRRG